MRIKDAHGALLATAIPKVTIVKHARYLPEDASGDPAVRASCVEFVLAGLYSMEKISRGQQHGRVVYQVG